MSVYIKQKPSFLDQAFLSIWDQQTTKPDEIILVKDGPLSSGLEVVIEKWKKELGNILVLIDLKCNVGLGAALNIGLKACRHELVARMDTDDISLPKRFQKQIAFMKNNPNVVASSAQLEEWDEELEFCTGKRLLPVDSLSIVAFAKRRCPLSHPLVIYRKSVILNLGGYPPLRNAQDYALWSLLISKGYELSNLPDTLLRMRTGNELYNRRGWRFFRQELALLKYQRDIGFLNFLDFYSNFLIKACLRLSPFFVKRLAYRYAR